MISVSLGLVKSSWVMIYVPLAKTNIALLGLLLKRVLYSKHNLPPHIFVFG